MRCPHCGREVSAKRTGEGVRVRGGHRRAFVIGAPCPYPECHQSVFARVPTSEEGIALTTLDDVASWSPKTLFAPLVGWRWPLILLLGFAVIPLYGIHEAIQSVRCGGVAWLFFAAGSLLALVPVLCLLRGLAFAAHEELKVAIESRRVLRRGGQGGLSLTPDPRGYRSH